jgi:hypothetical protein
MIYLIAFAVLVSGGILLLALPGFFSPSKTETDARPFEERVPVSMRRNGRSSPFTPPVHEQIFTD